MRRPLPPPFVFGLGRRHVEAFLCVRLERIDWMAQAEQLKQQMLATLSDRDQQLRQLTAMLEEARSHRPKPQQEPCQREEVDTAPGAPQQRSQLESHAHQAQIKELQRRFRTRGKRPGKRPEMFENSPVCSSASGWRRRCSNGRRPRRR